MLLTLIRITQLVSKWFAAFGGLIILIQMVWISYGVFRRYVMRSPDAYVTEATALLLFPVAFLGLAYALSVNAYPTVTYLVDSLRGNTKRFLLSVNLLIMLAIGMFFSYASVNATLKSFRSGSASEILLWPRYYFWAVSAVALILFTWYALLRFLLVVTGKAPELQNKGDSSC